MLNQIVLAYGGPGSGKDTLANFLSHHHHWGHASMSRALRQIDEAFAGLGIMDTIERGSIVELDLVMPAFQLKLAEFARIPPSNKNLFFQGVLRSPDQVARQVKLATNYSRKVIITKLDLDDETMLSRILKRSVGRADDQEHVARLRISEYRRSEQKIDQCVQAVLKNFTNDVVQYNIVDASKPLQTVVSHVMNKVVKA